MIESKEKTINGVTYMVTQFPARRALRLQTKLVKLLAPSVSALAGGANLSDVKNVMDAKIGGEVISKAVTTLVERLDEDYVVNLIMELLASTRREGKEISEAQFDMIYAGNFKELFQALYFVVEVNFGSFFQDLRTGNQE
jgi:hypothetical protein